MKLLVRSLTLAVCAVAATLALTCSWRASHAQETTAQKTDPRKTMTPKPPPGTAVPVSAKSSTRSRRTSAPATSRAVSASTVTTPSLLPHVTSLDMDALSLTAEKIKQDRPSITVSTLDCDREVVTETLPVIKESFASKGMEEGDALDAVKDGWRAVRLESRLSPAKCMVQASFQNYVRDLGKMLFRTDPDHASIAVSGKPLNKETSHKRWYEPNTYNVKYTKAGFQSVERQCKISKSEVTDCFAQLPPNP